MKYLLDTHSFLWFIKGDKQLSEKAKKCIANPNAAKYISIATFWEIAIKINIGKLKLDMPFEDLEKHILPNGFDLLPINVQHTFKLLSLDLHHRDPFDRIIIAQSLVEKMIIVTKDENFSKYKKR